MEKVNQAEQKPQGNWVPISKAFVSALPHNDVRPYTDLEAIFSLTVDYDTDKPVTVRGYAALWRWSRGKVERFLEGVGVEIQYPENPGKDTNQGGPLASHLRATNRPLNFIDSKWLRTKTSHIRATDEPPTDHTINPNPNPNPKDKKTSCPKPEKLVSPDALRLSELFADMILKNNPQNRSVNNGKREGTVQKWAADIDFLIRIDNQPPAEIEKVIKWSQSDKFWKGNILSGSKLRKQWDTLSAKLPSEGIKAAGQKQDSTNIFDGVVMGER